MSKRILIVEDEDDNLLVIQHIMEYILEQKDLQVARDGHEAIKKAYEYQPDIILMDLTLPKLSGWEATRSLKNDPQFANTAILALTAHAMVGNRERALEAGCEGYFTKPVDIDQFVEFLKPYLY